MSNLDFYDRSLPRDPRNMVGKQVAQIIASRTDLKGDYTTGMHGQSAFMIANDIHSGNDLHDDLPIKKFKKHWKA